ncbi:MAG: chitobiase/beta-hexosaminidase C-terminal domain-containing protein [Lachnospiraceae bacterium]|nr:chitobiase/beta-hexosaminidase C-terminal domain-containing protein [Lachnospiraceae bacterium]
MRKKALLSILFIAVLMICAACSSSEDPVTVPENNTNVSDPVKTVTEVPEPTFSSSEADGITSVKIFVSTVGAQIYYSTDGSDYRQYSSPIAVMDSLTIYAYAEVDGIKSKTVSSTFKAPEKQDSQPSDNNSNTDTDTNTDINTDAQDIIDQNSDTDEDYNGDIDSDDIDDGYSDSSDENLPDYGTYAYKPDGQIPFFEELTLDDLFSSELEKDKKLDQIKQAHKEFCETRGVEYVPLDPSSVGKTPERLRGIYYKVKDLENDHVPFDEVEDWLVMFEGGVYAFFDRNFNNLLSCGALMHEPDKDWQTFTVNTAGEIDVLWEFNSGDISCSEGYFMRAFELWDYDSADTGTAGDRQTGNAGSSDDALSKYFDVDPITEFFTMDTSLFGSSYNEFKKKIGMNDLMQPEDWPWWGNDLKVVYVGTDFDTFACFFQNDSLVTVYRDAPSEGPGLMYHGAQLEYGDSNSEFEYWNGTPAYEWILSDCYYQQYMESYSEGEIHYRQQYISFEYQK